MLHVKPLPPTPSVSRPRPSFTSRGKASGLAVQVSRVTQHLGNTITGWLLSEVTAKSAQQSNGPSTAKRSSFKKADKNVSGYAHPKTVIFTPEQQQNSPPTPGYLGIPLGRKRPTTPEDMIVVEEIEEDEDVTITVELPRIPPTSSQPLASIPIFSVTPKPRTQFTESLPIAPKQLLPPLQSPASKSITQRKPTPINSVPPPCSSDEIEHLPTPPFSDLAIPYSLALDSPPTMEYSALSASIISSSPRFDTSNPPPPRQSYRPRFQRTHSSTVENMGFIFDFHPVVPDKNYPPLPRLRRPREQHKRAGTSQCMQDFIEEYVDMRRRRSRRMRRDQKFPVAGQLMCLTDVGSVYAYSHIT